MQDWMFWAAATGMGLAVLAVLVQAMRRAQPVSEVPGSADLRIYRDQLAEIERDVARGTLPAPEAARLRTEVSRRLLEADKLVQSARAPVGAGRTGVALALVAASVAGAVWLYVWLGVPGYPDLPLTARIAMSDAAYANRPSQSEAEAAAPAPAPRTVDPAFADLMAKLRVAVTERPDDPRGLELLARNEAALGNFVAAREAQAALIDARGDGATAEDHAALAEITILAAGGIVTETAERALITALQIDPANGTARYYSGLMFAQVGRPDRTFSLWRPLLDDGPADAPWSEPIRAQIEEIAAAAGIRYTLPDAPGMPGPDEGDLAAAAEMTPEERQAMVAGMVAQLAERLATEGGPASDWARLITALGVQGETARAHEIWTEAEALFADTPADAAKIAEAAARAGLTR